MLNPNSALRCGMLLTAALGAFLLLTSSGCSSGRPTPQPWVPSPFRITWPEPPAQARIEYLGALRAGSPAGRDSFTAKVGRFLVGRREKVMIRPVALSGDGAGHLVVADPGVPTLHLYDLGASRYSQPPEEVIGRLRSPVGVALGTDGRIFVADSQQGRVFVLDSSGELLGEWGSGTLERPTGLALNPAGTTLFVVDTLQNEVIQFDMSGQVVGRFGKRGTGPGEFNYPVHAAFTSEGDFCLTDSLNFRVQVLRQTGDPLLEFGSAGDSAGDFTRPKGVAIDTKGRFYVVDAAFENIQIFDRQGRLLLAFAGPGTGPGELSLPAGICLGPGGRIYVADSYNQRVQVFRILEIES